MKKCETCIYVNQNATSYICKTCDENYSEWKMPQEYTDILIDELEKINIEINLSVKTYTDGGYKRGFDIARLMILEIIDNHISELKGERE